MFFVTKPNFFAININVRINITKQTNEQECGVCVITTLANYFNKINVIKKQDVLEKAKISTSGLTIYDFEILAKKYDLEIDSFEVKWEEFKDLKHKTPLVCLVKKDDNSNHYIIIVKHQKYLKIYDSCYYKPTKMSYHDFKKIFCNVLIFVRLKKNLTKAKKIFFNKKISLFSYDLKFILISIFISLASLGLSILSSSFLNWLIDLAIIKESTMNLVVISTFFIFIYFIQISIDYSKQLYFKKQLRCYYFLISNKILSSLEQKQLFFTQKIDNIWLKKIDQCIFSISNFLVIDSNTIIVNLLIFVIYLCIVCSIHWFTLIYVICFSVIEIVFLLIQYRKKQSTFIELVRSENKNFQLYDKLSLNINYEFWQSKRKFLINQIKKNYDNIYKNFNDASIFNANVLSIQNIVKSFIEVSFIAISCYFIIEHKWLTIGKLSFLLFSMQIFKSTLNDFSSYFFNKIEFDVFWDVYQNITKIGKENNKKQDFVNFVSLKTLKFIDHDNYLVLKTNNINVCNDIKSWLLNSNKIIFDDKKQFKTNSIFLNNLVIIEPSTLASIEYFKKIIGDAPKLFSNFLKMLNIDFEMINYSNNSKFWINLLCLLVEKNQIILLGNIDQAIKTHPAFKPLINEIKTHNAIFMYERRGCDLEKH